MYDDDERLGFRSKLVLMKLGFDLRPIYDDLLDAPISGRLRELSDRLLGYAEWRDAPERREPSRAGVSSPSRTSAA